MSSPQQPIPVTADDVADYDFEAEASPPPGTLAGGSRRLGLLAQADPGHLATDEEWATIVAHAEGNRP